MTLKQIIDAGFKEVIVKSYGYMSAGILSHYEPFGNQPKEIIFKLEDGTLWHKYFFLISEDTEFYYIHDGKVYCDDPDMKEYSRYEE